MCRCRAVLCGPDSMLAPLLLHATAPVVSVKARQNIHSWPEASCERHSTGTLPNGAPLPGPASQSLGLAPVRPFGPVAKTDGSAAAAAAAADGEQSTAPMIVTDASMMQSGSGHVSRHIGASALCAGSAAPPQFAEWAAPGEEKPEGIVDWSAVAPPAAAAPGSPSPAESGWRLLPRRDCKDESVLRTPLQMPASHNSKLWQQCTNSRAIILSVSG